MKRILHRVDTEGKKAGLKLNSKKTKVIESKTFSGIPFAIIIFTTTAKNISIIYDHYVPHM